MRQHGTTAKYWKDRCRCAYCREAKRLKARQYRARQRENGSCQDCGRPLAEHSVSRCEKHLADHAARQIAWYRRERERLGA